MRAAELQALVQRDDTAADLLPSATKDAEGQEASGAMDLEAGSCTPQEEPQRYNADSHMACMQISGSFSDASLLLSLTCRS